MPKDWHDWIGFFVAIGAAILLSLAVADRQAYPAALPGIAFTLVAGPLPICFSGRTAYGEMERLSFRPALFMDGPVKGTVFENDRAGQWISLTGRPDSPRACFIARGSDMNLPGKDASDE